MKVEDIQKVISNMSSDQSIYIPEFSYKNRRIDAIVIDIKKREIHGFEIKTSRSDFNNDRKWIWYSEFCSDLTIICPEKLIKPIEIENPFGLLWVKEESFETEWKRKPSNFQKQHSLSWVYTYLSVLEQGFIRLQWELNRQQKLQIGPGCDLGQSRLEAGVNVIGGEDE